jgi:phage terminase large subunit
VAILEIEIDIGNPQPKQIEFLQARTKYIGYGGSRGGGKSWAIRCKTKMLALKNAGIRILILRRTYGELYDNHILPLQQELPPSIAKYNDEHRAFSLLNGSRISFGYCQNAKDLLQYQGKEYDIIFIDEATHFEENVFKTLTASLRGVNNFPKRIYLTCNPSGIGHEWVKRLFIDRQFKGKENPNDYTFIQSRVYDNKVLMASDPEYVKNLEALPEKQRKAWLYGDWNIFDGQYFSEWNYDIHTCNPFEIPKHWNYYTTMDYGLDMLAWYMVAVDEQGEVYVTNEIYLSGLIVSDAVKHIKEFEQGKEIYTRYAPPDLWNTQSAIGKSTALIFGEYGLYLDKANNDRIAGWMTIHELLKITDGKAKLHIFRNCKNLIRCLPLLQFDEKKPNDTANEPHEITHSCDGLRYFAISWTAKTEPIKKPRTWWDEINGGDDEEKEFWK